MTSTVDLLHLDMRELARTSKPGDTIVVTDGSNGNLILRVEAVPAEGKRPPIRLGALQYLGIKNFPTDLPELSKEELLLREEGERDDPLYTGMAR